ncbi:MAG: CHAT domain-containing protein [Actinomycetota bacterium]|nr:CHAT domain-containing protein [Actinomycetota bacterium]
MPSTQDDKPPFDRSPIYAVLFHVTGEDGPYQPLVTERLGGDSSVTVPHGLDREVATALPALWYCLHLPSTFADFVDMPVADLKVFQTLHLDHHILLAPVTFFDEAHVGPWLADGVPALVVCPDDVLDDVAMRSEMLGFTLPPAAYSRLSDESLQAHWASIGALLGPGVVESDVGLRLSHRLDLAPAALAHQRLIRQIGHDEETPLAAAGDPDGALRQGLWDQSVLAATARLERAGVGVDVAEESMPDVLEEERRALRLPLTVALPGVAPAYIRSAFDPSLRDRVEHLEAGDEADTWAPEIHERSDGLVERAAIEFVATHRAVARSGLGVMMSAAPANAFGILSQLERHFETQTPSGSAVWGMLDKLNALTEHLWSDALEYAVAHASMLTAFANFPFGLLRLPGDTSPICTRVPISYRPLLPLTRAVQYELTYVPAIDLSETPRVLVAECISPEDPVGAMARAGWKAATDFIRSSGEAVRFEVVKTLSVAALRAAITEQQPDILIISAHGILSPRRDLAGLLVGDEPLLGPEVGPLPSVVILSACNVAPRGAGAVSITDLLLREGAVAVLGTQVPVDVRRNARLIARFLVYIVEVLNGREDHLTLLDVWHRVQSSNAVLDVLSGSPMLERWGYSEGDSGPPVFEFMSERSAGRLRTGHVYADTEEVLGEIADEQGVGPRIRNWFKNPGYLPESLFYVFAGRPERIYLRSLVDAVGRGRR